jgi:hypothetical protein
VETSCEFGIEPSGSMKCWETIEWLACFDHYWLTSKGIPNNVDEFVIYVTWD